MYMIFSCSDWALFSVVVPEPVDRFGRGGTLWNRKRQAVKSVLYDRGRRVNRFGARSNFIIYPGFFAGQAGIIFFKLCWVRFRLGWVRTKMPISPLIEVGS